MGFKALNTGCATLWSFTHDFCRGIPSGKSESVVFTLTHHYKNREKDQLLIDTLNKSYENVYFWIQDADDFEYLKTLEGIQDIKIIPPTIEAYEKILNTAVDYIGTRLHGGIFAMRHKKRAIIISIDERAKGMGETYNLNLIDREDLNNLEKMINSEFITDVQVNFDVVNQWLKQFSN